MVEEKEKLEAEKGKEKEVEKINFYRKTAIIVGVLFITATAAYSLGVILLDPILGDSDYLTKASENENQVIIGAPLY